MRWTQSKFSTADEGFDRRSHPREPVEASTVVRTPGQTGTASVEMRNLSRSGCQFDCEDDIPIGTRIVLGLDGAGSIAAVVIRSNGGNHACLFERHLTPAEQAQAFTGAAVVTLFHRLPETHPAIVAHASESKLPRHQRYRLALGLAATCWIIGGAIYLVI